MNWSDWVTFGLAVLGASLGVLNYFRESRRDSVRLIVRPVVVEGGPMIQQPQRLGIEVINTGLIAVTIDSVGMVSRKGLQPPGQVRRLLRRALGREGKKNCTFPDDVFKNRWAPKRLEARAGFIVETALSPDCPTIKDLRFTYATTECGLEIYGRGPKAAKKEIKIKV